MNVKKDSTQTMEEKTSQAGYEAFFGNVSAKNAGGVSNVVSVNMSLREINCDFSFRNVRQ